MHTPAGRSLCVAPPPLAGGSACGPAEPVPRRLLGWMGHLCLGFTARSPSLLAGVEWITPAGASLRVAPPPLAGGDASSPAEPVLRRLCVGDRVHARRMRIFFSCSFPFRGKVGMGAALRRLTNLGAGSMRGRLARHQRSR